MIFSIEVNNDGDTSVVTHQTNNCDVSYGFGAVWETIFYLFEPPFGWYSSIQDMAVEHVWGEAPMLDEAAALRFGLDDLELIEDDIV